MINDTMGAPDYELRNTSNLHPWVTGDLDEDLLDALEQYAFTNHTKVGDCHIWKGPYFTGYDTYEVTWSHQNGTLYGAMAYPANDGHDRYVSAHVMVWELDSSMGVPKGMVVRHTCDRPSCVNPAHLLIGKQSDNVVDRDSRGRSKKGMQFITDQDEQEIFERFSNREATIEELSETYGIGIGQVNNILIKHEGLVLG